MRLLNVETFRLEDFNGSEDEIPEYAILSHRWGDTEITFEDMRNTPLEELRRRPEFFKIKGSCCQAQSDGYTYIWNDTCCINKSSSAELSEAINSMFRWYQQAAVCYVFLADVDGIDPVFKRIRSSHPDVTERQVDIRGSEWFKRGWTLQELIAPRKVQFFDKSWISIGDRNGFILEQICRKTRIDESVFRQRRCNCPKGSFFGTTTCLSCKEADKLPDILEGFPVSVRMSWASGRQTTRVEDSAYSLLGLFNVHMPLLYGEGTKAFQRLQAEIVRQTKDQSILLWRPKLFTSQPGRSLGCLASSPADFNLDVPLVGRRDRYESIYRHGGSGAADSMTIRDGILVFNTWICPCVVLVYDAMTEKFEEQHLFLAILDCATAFDYLGRPAIFLEPWGEEGIFRRVHNRYFHHVDPRQLDGNIHFRVGADYGHSTGLPDQDTLTVTHSLGDSYRKTISVLLEPTSRFSPLTLLVPSGGSERTGPIYLVNRSERRNEIRVDALGSYPPLASYASHMGIFPELWCFLECRNRETKTMIGGLHIIKVEGPGLECSQSFAVLWGLFEAPVLLQSDDDVKKSKSWKVWCTVTDARGFFRDARASTQNFSCLDELMAVATKDVETKLMAHCNFLTLESYEHCHVSGGSASPRRLFPDFSDAAPTQSFNLDTITIGRGRNLSISVDKVGGLGRTVYEICVSVLP